MGVANPQFNVWLVPWPWWILIGLAAGFVLLLALSVLTAAKQADERLDEYAREHRRERRLSNRAKRNGRGRS